MSEAENQSPLIVVRHSPYGSSLGKVSVDTVLAAAAFDCEPVVLYMGEGVLQLKSEQNADAIEQKSISKQIASFPMYDIELVYVEAEAAERFGVDLQAVPFATKAVDAGDIRALMNSCQHILSL
jgi:tRNA 2-thiouridine synthesizing protein C